MAENLTYTDLRKRISSRAFAPIFLLHGQEGYYIDTLVKDFEAVIPEEERDFNLYTLYASQVKPDTVIDTCRRYPMMSDYQVVILKEAQAVPATFMNALENYVNNPSPATVLVICVRGDVAKGKEFLAALRKSKAVVFESKKLNERSIGAAIASFVKEKGLNIEPKALEMLGEYVGTDLSRLYNEVDKLTMVLGKGAMITPEAIERNIGFSKDYNTFELVDALAAHNGPKAMRIVDYYRRNPKANPVQMIAPTIFNFFSNVLVAYYAADKSERGLMAELGLKWPGQLKGVQQAMRWYGPWQVIEILQQIRRLDVASKGVGSRQDAHDMLCEVVFRILNPLGQKGVEI